MTNQVTEGQWNITKTSTLRFVVHDQVESYKLKGWRVVNDLSHCHHGIYSVIMEKSKELQD